MNKISKKIFVCMLTICLIFSMVAPALAEECQPTALNWMSLIDGNLTLAQFTIPGTHDSTTKNA